MKKIDMIVHTHHMYTMQGDGVGYEKDKSIAVDGGKIIEIAAREEIEKTMTAARL